MILRGCVILTVLVLGQQCAPKVFYIDRHSLMEEESSGTWPEFKTDKAKKGPVAIPSQELDELQPLKADQ